MGSLPAMIGLAAVAVMVAGLGAQFAGASARAAVIDHLGVRRLTGQDGEGSSESFAYFVLGLDPAPIAWAFGLALVAAAFQIGTRLQRDTDLLV